MEIIKVGIRVKDPGFGKALAKGIAIQGRKILLTAEEEQEPYDLILTDDIPVEKREIFLSENKEKDILLQEMPYSVYRYTDSCKMTEILYYAFFKLTGKTLSCGENRKCHLITAMSLSGGAYATTVLLSLAEYFSVNYGRKCLYFSLCPTNTIAGEHAAHRGSFLKLIYYLQDKADFPIGIFISKTENVDYLATEIFNPSFMEMNKELLLVLLEKLNREEIYDFLLVDTGNHISYETMKIGEVSEGMVLFRKYGRSFTELPEIKGKDRVLDVITAVPSGKKNGEGTAQVRTSENLLLQGEYEKDIETIGKWIGEQTGYGK